VPQSGEPVVLFADTFTTYFEPENARAAENVLNRAGFAVETARAADADRPLCCGRTFLATGLIYEARWEAQRTLDALTPYVKAGVPVVGLEPSCTLTLCDEYLALLPGAKSQALAANVRLFEDFIADVMDRLPLQNLPGRRALLHGHCHQKALGRFKTMEAVLASIPGLSVESIESSCCGMAGSFGYEAEHYEASMKMGELALLPAVRRADAETLIVADGTSCRQQIAHGTGREAWHAARVLASALA